MSFENGYFNLGYLDTLSYRDTFVHRIDSRVKLLVTLAFVLCIVSFSKYTIAGLLPFFVYPVFMLSAGEIPLKPIVKKILVVSPFVILVGIFNPVLDRTVHYTVLGVHITGGWISFFSIIIKFVLTISAALLLIATTSFVGICVALHRLRLPKVFVIQLLFLYRYLFVLLEETFRMVRARDARSFGRKGYGVKAYVSLFSVLMMRTLQRAEKIYGAMTSRGFSGEIKLVKKEKVNFSDILFFGSMVSFFILLRYYNVTEAIGSLLRRELS